MFTQPLWHNKNLHSWAYLYQDVSWIITLGWATILLLSMQAVDYYYKIKETKKFFLYLLYAGIIGVIAEALVLALGIRSYSPEILAIMTGITVPFTQVPIKALYYMPVFMALIIGFTRYFEMVLEEPKVDEKSVTLKKPNKPKQTKQKKKKPVKRTRKTKK